MDQPPTSDRKIVNLRQRLYHQAIVLLPSALPYLLSINLVTLLLLLITWYNPTVTTLFFSSALNSSLHIFIVIILIELIIIIAGWFYDMYVEASLGGYYTAKVRKNLRHGFYAFVISEAMLFFSFFWAYFHSAISPTVQLGNIWPPLGIPNILTTGLPLLGTFILVLSGISITWTNKAIVRGGSTRFSFGLSLFITISLGFLFLSIQTIEYFSLKFNFNDSVLGSCFYLLTGFHGFHVFLGLLFLIVSYWLFYQRSLTQTNYLFLELSILYWHFVDLIWIALFFLIYCWGFGGSFIQQSTTYLEPNIFLAGFFIYLKHNESHVKRILDWERDWPYKPIQPDSKFFLNSPDWYWWNESLIWPKNSDLPQNADQQDPHILQTLESIEWNQLLTYVGPNTDLFPIAPELFATQDGFSKAGAYFFQKPFTDSAREIVSFHSYLFTLIIVLAIFVFWLFLTILIHFKEDLYDRNILPSEIPYIWERTTWKAYGLSRRRGWKRRIAVNYNVFQILEFWWTVIPGLIILGLSIASLLLLYSWDTGLGISLEGRKNNILQNLMVKIKGSQWFWTYEFTNPIWSSTWWSQLPQHVMSQLSVYNITSNRSVKFESHLAEGPLDYSYFIGKDDQYTNPMIKLLSTTGELNLPVRFIIKLIITSSDVIHSWAIPAFGVKIDAIPGRANVQSILIHSIGTAYGQCSEICGIKHAFMPIAINTLIDLEWSLYLGLTSLPEFKLSVASKEWYQALVGVITKTLDGWERFYLFLGALIMNNIKDSFFIVFYDLSVSQGGYHTSDYSVLDYSKLKTREIFNSVNSTIFSCWTGISFSSLFLVTHRLFNLRSLSRRPKQESNWHKIGTSDIIITSRIRYIQKPYRQSREALEKPGSRDKYKAPLVDVPLSSFKVLNDIHSYWYTTPGNLGNAYALGFLLMFGIIIQLLTGMLLVANYEPTLTGAFESVQWIRRDIVAGYLVQSTHAIGASILFIALYLHIFRGLYVASYQKKSTWLTGIGIYFLLALIAFLGYCLPWGQMSLWGCKVITSFLTAIPYIGFTLVEWVWGGPSINDETLKRFYMLHIILNAVLLFLIGLHIRALHKEGSSSPLCTVGNAYIDFFPYIPIKDTLMINTYLVLLLSTILYDPNLFSHPENFNKANPLVTPDQIVPEWYFLPFYAILRSIPSKTGGLIAMIGAILVWAILPWLAGPYYKGKWDSIFSVGYGFNISTVILLGWLGAQPLRQPFLALASTCTWIYFFYFLAFIPFFTRRRTVRFFPRRKFRYYFQFFPTMTFKEGMVHYGSRTFNWWRKNAWDWLLSFKNTPFNH